VAVGGMLKRHLAPQTLERLLRQELIKEDAPKQESKIYTAVKGIFTDKAGNEGSAKLPIIVYDPANTVAPTLTVVEELPTIAMDADASAIDWTAYITEAKDASGLDLKAKVVADVSVLDTSMPDVYPVTLTVADYVGNTTSVEIQVEVVVE